MPRELTSEKPVAERLRKFFDEPGAPSIREVARRLAGPGATERQAEAQRRYLAKVLRGQHEPKRKKALAIARAAEAPDEAFMPSRQQQVGPRQLLQMVLDLRAEVAELQQAVEVHLESSSAVPPPRARGSRQAG